MIVLEKFKNNLNPHIKIKYKNESALMKILGAVLFFNKDFSTKFITTLGNTIYFPSRDYIEKNKTGAVSVFTHEYVHVYDSKKYSSIVFSLLYLFPQILFIFSLLSFWSLWFLLFLIFLVPLPAYWRSFFEFRAYSMTLFINYLFMKKDGLKDNEISRLLKDYAKYIDSQFFKGSAYYWMWPFGKMKEFEEIIERIVSGDILKEKTFEAVQKSFSEIYHFYEEKNI